MLQGLSWRAALQRAVQLWYKEQGPEMAEKKSKSLIHPFVFGDYKGLAINPYQGCGHRCAYCYATYEWSPEFYDRIYAKSNAPEVLDQQLSEWKSDTIGPVMVGSATDSYQPAEVKYGITRRCIEVLQSHNVPYYVFTKSVLVRRDLDLHSRYRDNCAIIWSLTTVNEKIRRVLEPGTPPSLKLLEVMGEFAGNGINCGVNIDPIIPLVTDSTEELRAIAVACRESGVKHAVGSVLRIRSDIWSRVKTVLELLGISDWQKRYGEIYDLGVKSGYGMASEQYVDEVEQRLHHEIKAARLESSFPKHLGERKIRKARLGQTLMHDFTMHDPIVHVAS